MTVTTTDWMLAGAERQPILVSADTSDQGAPPRAAVLLAHGFKGYKDYGFIPVLAGRLAERLPIVAHRFNFSHSGMTDAIATFARPDLFERDTWNKQVFDLGALLDAVERGDAPATDAGLPVIVMGHSRGGAACLISAGRRARDGVTPAPVAVITMSAPDHACNMSGDARAQMRREGFLVSPSARTGQALRIGRAWIEEQEADPGGHDMLGLCKQIDAPVLAIHGADDPTVDPACAGRIAAACPSGETFLIPGANHVYNTPNPADPAAPMTAQLASLVDHAAGFIRRHALESG